MDNEHSSSWIPSTKCSYYSTGCVTTTCAVKRKKLFKKSYLYIVFMFFFQFQLIRISREVEQFKVRLNNGSTIGWPDICFK